MTDLLVRMTLSPVQSLPPTKPILTRRAKVQEWRTTNKIKDFNGEDTWQTMDQLFKRFSVKDILWYPEKIIPVLVVAEDSKSLDENDVIFKSLYFPFLRFSCKIKIWSHYIVPLDFHAIWVNMWSMIQVWKLDCESPRWQE